MPGQLGAAHITHITRFGLDDAPDAYRKLAGGELVGRAVIEPGR